MKFSKKNVYRIGLAAAMTALFMASSFSFAVAGNILENARVDASGVGTVSKVSPGEFLPVAVKLLNFGGGKKIDVSITYRILNEDMENIYSYTETVAVETTASFIKNIEIPASTPPGKYIAKASISYQDQLVPADTAFHFTVERKILGIYQKTFLYYAVITVVLGGCTGMLGKMLVRRFRRSRLGPLDYSTAPAGQKVFYELMSDTILQMRQRVGDVALDIASEIDGLTIDDNTGRVLRISKSPSKIIAVLVSGYEKALGEKVSFSFRDNQITKYN